jgi:hypothetical protein
MPARTGSVCENCKERWEKRKKEPKILQRLGTTEKKNYIVTACEYCDGPAIEINALGHHEPLQAD